MLLAQCKALRQEDIVATSAIHTTYATMKPTWGGITTVLVGSTLNMSKYVTVHLGMPLSKNINSLQKQQIL
jgi:hypothetical protein